MNSNPLKAQQITEVLFVPVLHRDIQVGQISLPLMLLQRVFGGWLFNKCKKPWPPIAGSSVFVLVFYIKSPLLAMLLRNRANFQKCSMDVLMLLH